MRAFSEKGDASQPARTPFVAADAELPTKLVAEAEAAAKKGLALYVVAGTVSGPGKAKAGDVIAIETVLVDLDHGDVSAKREHLVKHLGPPSLEVASGGVTAEGQERLHLYWKLNEPATGADIAKVCDLRGVIAAKAGGDPSFRSAHQPIRVAGSVYRKGGVERLVIVRTERAVEHDLTEFADRWKRCRRCSARLTAKARSPSAPRARSSISLLTLSVKVVPTVLPASTL